MARHQRTTRSLLLGATALAGALALSTGSAAAQQREYSFDLPAQPLDVALRTYARTAEQQVIFAGRDVLGRTSSPVNGSYSAEEALQIMLAGSDLTVQRTAEGVLQIARASEGPQSGSAAGGGAEVEALIVTAQKREEDIQDVPIAISAFTQEDLTRSQVAGGPDLITQVPNMTFTKTNFSSYSIQLRGIGTQAISATTDPAVAVAFNNTPFIRNRFFEQEFYDLQRVEVLRGPQGTLYGRNATAGVVNLISQKPKFVAEAKASADVSNFTSSRIEGMINIPLVEDMVALRLAGAWTKRDGYATNQLTGNPIDGRDLWSTRLTLRVTPNDRIDANLIWEHFQEDDDRLRSGKQLCKKDVVTEVAGVPVDYYEKLVDSGQGNYANSVFSQGCTRESLYSPDSFQTPNGLMLPYYTPLGAVGLPRALEAPYVSEVQSPDLRMIESAIDPHYRAKSDLGELQISFDLTDTLTLVSETAYANDWVYSLQDFNRFNTAPGAWLQPDQFNTRENVLTEGPNGGIFCDPQLGCSDRLVAVDISTATATQFSQELRLASDYNGPFNFSLGANLLRGDSEDKYYVFINSISLIAASGTSFAGNSPYEPGVTDNTDCLHNPYKPGDPNKPYSVTACVYLDPNPIESVNDQGHNYFLSKNPYKLISYAVFGEAYYKPTDALKITAGLRWTVDKKEAPRIPTWILAAQSYGYPVAEVIEQEWREPTGRLAIDWKPDLPFTDETLLYASYAHGYKAGGANPPGFVRVFYADNTVTKAEFAASLTRPKTFDPEFVDAYELGAKNTLADGRMILNLAAFYYDYTGYQVSEIVDRSAFNRNFDATVWGVELEGDWRPLENLRLGLKGGYEDTRIADGEQAIDLMDRTAGDPRWTLVRPFPTYASSCILPTWLMLGSGGSPTADPVAYVLGSASGGGSGGCELAYIEGVDPRGGATSGINYAAYSTDINDYPGWPTGVPLGTTYPGWDPATAPNNGEGIAKQLGGNQLPNAPHWTWTITGDYTLPLAGDWLVNLHTDLHWQGASYWRVFNDHEYDKLDEYFTMNLAAIFTNEEAGWNVMAYIKNVTDETAITGAFLNSDDTGLTTNVFLTEPRLYGLRVTKAWTGSSTFGGFSSQADSPFTVELGGQVQRHDAPTTALHPEDADAFPGPLDVFDATQAKDLDWGDGREVRVSYRPGQGPWTVSLGWRNGETNGYNTAFGERQTEPVCGFGTFLPFFCNLNPAPSDFIRSAQHFIATDRADALVYDREENTVADVAIERDTPFGGLSRSSVSASLAYVDLQSTTNAELRGIPDWNVPAGFLTSFSPFSPPTTSHTVYNIRVDAEREFKGAGPQIAWSASQALWNTGQSGHFDVDWSLGGGVFFGSRKAKIVTNEKIRLYLLNGYYTLAGEGVTSLQPQPTTTTVLPPIEVQRSKDVTVPAANASLGLSYKVGGFSVGAGYRWERYFDAIDGGFEDAKEEDRTIDGPYFKVSVGFGG